MVDLLTEGPAVAIMDTTIKAVLAGSATLVKENEGDNYINFLMPKEILLQAGYENYKAVSSFSSGRNPPTLKH
jgi:ATP sulfurylase